MRSINLKHAAAHEADEIAGDAFDRQTPGVKEWIADAIRGEWATDDYDAAMHVLDRAVFLSLRPADVERVASLRRAVAHLRDRYIDHASVHGTYAAEAFDNVAAKAEEAAEAQREAYELDRQIEADEAASIRQADALQAELRG